MTQAERIKDLFQQAVELPRGERGEFLRAQCGDDSAVRSAVGELLALEASAPDEFLNRMAFDGPDDGTEAQPAIPAMIGRFLVVRLIARGGMGAVYEAQQEEPRRTVAVKVIRTDAASAGMLRRFRHEGDILARLQHPGIAQIYETGTADLGYGPQPYIAMEYVSGATLQQYLTERVPPHRARLELFAKICDAAHYAHTNGVIHRDLKPANVLVGAEGQPKIVDFGVARLQQGEEQPHTQHTIAGQIVGTLTYMSPEQVAGGAALLDARSDVYSLGVILFEVLCGRGPYELTGKSLAEAARIISEQEPSRSASINAALPGDLDSIVRKALEKERERRYVSAADLAADLRRYLADQPVLARPQTAFYLLRKFARRNRWLVTASMAAVVSLLAGLIGVSIFAHRESQLRRDAQRVAYRAALGSASVMIQNHQVASAQQNLEQAPATLRGWEWRHLFARLDESQRAIATGDAYPSGAYIDDHGRVMSCVSTVPPTLQSWVITDGSAPPTAESDVEYYNVNDKGTAELRVTRSRRLHVRTIPGGAERAYDLRPWLSRPDSFVHFMTLSDDAKYLLFREIEANRIDVVELSSGEHFRRNVFLEAWHRFPAFAGDDCVVSPLFGEKAVEFWNFRSGAVRLAAVQPSPVEVVAMPPGGESFFTGSQDSILRKWNTRSGELLASAAGHSDYITAMTCSPDGTRVATVSPDCTLRLWDVRTLAPRGAFHGHTARINFVRFSPDGHWVATSSSDRTIRIWACDDAGKPNVLSGHQSYVYRAAFSPDGRRILSAGWDGFFGKPGGLRLWDAMSGRQLWQFGGPEDWFFDAAFSPDGLTFAAAGVRGLTIRDAISGAELARRDDLKDINRYIAFDATGRRVIVSGGKLIDAATGVDLPCKIACDGAVAVSCDGRWFAADSGHGIELWDADSQRRVHELKGPKARASCIDFRADSRMVTAACDEATVYVWAPDDGRLVARLDSPGGGALCAAFSPDGTRLVTGGRDQVIHVWDTGTWDELVSLYGHTAYVKSLAFSPDGATLISASGDGTIRVWDSRSIRQRRALVRD